mmetsp:Transcript_2539/g.6086  ORF Transcript_2539/g.6086 Transcript_2539/m.6086 type:complete len:204 (+) Transcript_2539:562-1173(+)
MFSPDNIRCTLSEVVSLHHPFPFDHHPRPSCCQLAPPPRSDPHQHLVAHSLRCSFRHVNNKVVLLRRFSCRCHSCRYHDSISKDAEARVLDTDNSAADRSETDANPDRRPLAVRSDNSRRRLHHPDRRTHHLLQRVFPGVRAATDSEKVVVLSLDLDDALLEFARKHAVEGAENCVNPLDDNVRLVGQEHELLCEQNMSSGAD